MIGGDKSPYRSLSQVEIASGIARYRQKCWFENTVRTIAILREGPMSRLGLVAAVVMLFLLTCLAQQRINSGQWKGFLQEQPPLNLVEVPIPIKVSRVRGTIYYGERAAVAGATFELRDKHDNIVSVVTDSKGSFQVPNIAPGVYPFKVTMDGFHSTIGTVIVSDRSPKKNLIEIQLRLGT